MKKGVKKTWICAFVFICRMQQSELCYFKKKNNEEITGIFGDF